MFGLLGHNKVWIEVLAHNILFIHICKYSTQTFTLSIQEHVSCVRIITEAIIIKQCDY